MGVELVRVELGEDEPVFVFVVGGGGEKERKKKKRRRRNEGEKRKEVLGFFSLPRQRGRFLFLSFSCLSTHIKLIPERKQLLMGMSTSVMLPAEWVVCGESLEGKNVRGGRVRRASERFLKETEKRYLLFSSSFALDSSPHRKPSRVGPFGEILFPFQVSLMLLRRALSFPKREARKPRQKRGGCNRPLAIPNRGEKEDALAKKKKTERKKEKKLTESQSGRRGARSQRVLGGPTGQHDGDDVLGVRPVGGRGPVRGRRGKEMREGKGEQSCGERGRKQEKRTSTWLSFLSFVDPFCLVRARSLPLLRVLTAWALS
jgi:hypothetical protein